MPNFKSQVFDYINVAEIHNATIPSSNLLDNTTLFQLKTLANAHEFGLAYNATDDMRAISGMQLAGEILTYMNSTISGFAKHNNKLGIQFGAYATFLSFFGLTNLTAADERFYGVNDYASSMVFELFTTADVGSTAPSTDDLSVRFLFHNGTSETSPDPTTYPLFGQSSTTMSYNDFVGNMSNIAVRSTEQWCTKCGNFTGTCAAYDPSSSGSSGSDDGSSSGDSGSHISTAVGGVIGAMVTLAVILGVEALILVLGGLRIVSKKRLAGGATNGAVGSEKP